MTVIQGTITTFLSALGNAEASNEVQGIIANLGGEYETEAYNDTEVEEKYLLIPSKGVELLVVDDILNTVFIYALRSTTPGDEHEGYDTLPMLIEGLTSPTASRSEIRELLGEPAKEATLYDLYQVGERFVHFEFNEEGQLTKVTLMANDPRANVLSGPAEASTAINVGGTLTVLAAAIGHSVSDPETQAAISLFGSNYTEGAPSGGPDVVTQYLNFPAGHIQLKNNAVASIFFSTGLSFNDPVPENLRFDKLANGLSQKPTRESIQELLGEPYLKSPNFELYNIADTSVHIEYINDTADSITISALPANQ